MNINPFLNSLLKYEQDGMSAISSPSNWNDKPLLEVKTEIDDLIEELTADLLENSQLSRWHFLIGSPGNGKSAAVGKLYQKLKENNIVFKSRDKEIYSSKSKTLPYILEAYEGDENYSFAFFAQDASVVENPYADEISPAKEMLGLIREAWLKRKCLIICANRGIIEEASRIMDESEEFKNEKWLKKIFACLGKPQSTILDFDINSKYKGNCTQLKFSSSTLDFRSIVLNKPNGNNVFDQLLIEATKNDNWAVCDSCNYASMCPFKNNRDYLFNQGNKEAFIKLLKRAEVYSGQVIVFREALALIAFFLGGCSEDLVKGNVKSPCEWVENKINKEEVFDLMGRRIYMSLFSSFSPYGLEYNFLSEAKENITITQKKEIKEDANNTASKNTFRRLLKGFSNDWLSLNIGITRLIGEKGVFKDLHPIYGIPLNNYENEIQEKWDLQLDALIENTDHPLITEIEKSVFVKLKQLEDGILFSNENISQKLGWLCRWITNITYNIGILDSCKSNFDKELDQLVLAFEKPEGEEFRSIKKLLKESIAKIFEDENNKLIQITPNMLINDFDINPIKIEIPTGENKTYGLNLHFGTATIPIIINVQTYCWLTRKLASQVSSKTFPAEYLETLKVAQLKAIKDLNYNFKADVELRIKTPMEEYSIKREEGEIYSDYITKID